MTKKDIRLNEGVNNFKFDVQSADIMIYPDNIKEPLIRYTGKFDVENSKQGTIITEKSNNISALNLSLKNFRCIINDNITIVNGKVISGNNITTNNTENSSVELIVPKKSTNLSFDIENKSGDLRIEDLIMTRLIVKSMSGDITLSDINAFFTKLKTMSGDIDVEILESIINYRTMLKSMSGDTIQNSIEVMQPTMLNKKYQFEAETMSGDINILFKGKR